MKKIVLCMLAAASLSIHAAEPLKISLDPADNSRAAHEISMGRATYSKEQKTFTVKGADKGNNWLGISFATPVKAVPGKKIRFSGEYCCSIDNQDGCAFASLRQYDKAGKSISYTGVDMKGKNDWKPFSSEFTVNAQATGSLELFIIGKKINAKSAFSVRNLKIEEL